MAKVLLGVTGSVAAIYTQDLFADLRQAGHDVKIVATRSALYFFDPLAVEPTPEGERNRDVVVLDEDEWPGHRYQRGDPVMHIELRRWADVLLIAPCDANTLAKLALGISDNCLTCIYRAWDRTRPVILAPAMNTLMWEHPATERHLTQLTADLRSALHVIAPITKKLACEDVGVGAMAERAEIAFRLSMVLPPPD
ncbi:MAG: phosphopantothenoylcysteine decarboxylase [Planctomycetes bacterium]|jgi:phosphopantothenoylcysteine decarboxylase|nr:phosphopantothenoylcysteine decarboxylase [Planctomycetota bacterium]